MMSMAKRQEDLKDPGVRKRIAAWLAEPEERMAMRLRVKSDGEKIVVYQAYNPETEVTLSLAEAEAFAEELEGARDEATRCSEHRLAEEVQKNAEDRPAEGGAQVFSKDGME